MCRTQLSVAERAQVADISVLGITEAFRVKQQVLVSASEAAEMIIRVDDILKSAPRFERSFGPAPAHASRSQRDRV